ncbi:MAG: hypoxanthine phosphoribosyltransferase [Oscillospiraceae bacterium]|nr:hypoxanthine phosphoribosyltransferase [Candidatus Ruminococcus equi]
MHNDVEKILLSEEELQEAVVRIAKQIDEDYKGKEIVLVGLLKGSVVFMADLLKHITTPCRIDFMCVSSYGASTKSSGRVNILKDLSQPITDADVIIVEDIIDSGNTMAFIKQYFAAKNANSVKICTMLSKPSRRETEVDLDYVGYEVPDEFVVGYGLDYAEHYRNLSYIGVLKPSVYS